jgi:hypothetical protein
MPFTVELKYKDGSKKRHYLPVETWMQRKVVTVILPDDKDVESITIDPDNTLPDLNRGNNSVKVSPPTP